MLAICKENLIRARVACMQVSCPSRRHSRLRKFLSVASVTFDAVRCFHFPIHRFNLLHFANGLFVHDQLQDISRFHQSITRVTHEQRARHFTRNYWPQQRPQTYSIASSFSCDFHLGCWWTFEPLYDTRRLCVAAYTLCFPHGLYQVIGVMTSVNRNATVSKWFCITAIIGCNLVIYACHAYCNCKSWQTTINCRHACNGNVLISITADLHLP